MKTITLLLVALLLSAALSQASRPTPKPMEVEEGIIGGQEKVGKDVEVCEGVSDEECLVRRTLVAHTDYIYTQGAHHKP